MDGVFHFEKIGTANRDLYRYGYVYVGLLEPDTPAFFFRHLSVGAVCNRAF